MDIAEIILYQHGEQRRLFAFLDEIDPGDAASLSAIWSRLSALLLVHASAEEQFVYPELLRDAQSTDPDTDANVTDVIQDHNHIRDAVKASLTSEPGSQGWWQAVWAARQANDEHMAEEERADLWSIRKHLDLETRHAIAVSFIRFECENPTGVPIVDTDPAAYVEADGAA